MASFAQSTMDADASIRAVLTLTQTISMVARMLLNSLQLYGCMAAALRCVPPVNHQYMEIYSHDYFP